MDLVKGVITSVRQFYNDINPATLTGAIDVIVVEKPNGDLTSTPFHVRFGKINVMNFVGKTVEIYINDKPTDLRMKLGPSGEAFFVEASDEEPPANLSTSPLPELHAEVLPATTAAHSPKPSPRKRSDSSPAVVVKRREQAIANEKCTRIAEANIPHMAPAASAEAARSEGTPSAAGGSPKKKPGEAKGAASKTRDDTARDGSPSPKNRTPAKDASLVERTGQKVKKRRRKMSKQIAPGKAAATPESSSSDVEETQFQMDGLASEDADASSSPTITSFSAPALMSSPLAAADDESSAVLSSSEMKTAKTTQFNLPKSGLRPAGNANESGNRTAAREPVENNTSSTTVTSDDEFNWASVASGVAPARLNLAAGALGPATSLAVSDGDLSDSDSRPRNRPPSPARSDTLVELGHNTDELSGVEWSWGELPEGEIPPEIRAPTPLPSNNNSDRDLCIGRISDKDGRNGRTDNKNNNMNINNNNNNNNNNDNNNDVKKSAALSPELASKDRSTSPIAGQKHTDGLYLDDVLAQTDPEMRERYIGSRPRRAPARAQAPGAVGHWDGESGNGPSLSQSPQSGLDSDSEPDPRHPVFDYGLKRYSDLAMSLCGMDKVDGEGAEERFLARLVTYDEFCSHPEILQEPSLVFRINGRYYNWKCIAPQMLSLAMFQRSLPSETLEKLRADHMPKKKAYSPPQAKSRGWWWSRGGPQDVPDGPGKVGTDPQMKGEAPLVREQIPSEKKPSPSKSKAALLSAEEKTLSDEELLANQLMEEELKKSHNRKSLRLSSAKLKSLGLKPGTNLAEFKVITAYQGTSVCSCHVYLWKSTDKIVISDIDGTITKSDVLGHILPIIGNNWAQSGVASLFNKIDKNGYKLIYLSARAIGQAQMTRGFLRSLKQDNLLLPDGPVLLNPTSLLSALHREVVAKNPHIFKINCLRDVKQLFNAPDGTPAQPFYAGFGNKMTDALSYKTVSVPVNRIFTINHRGEISQELMGNVGKTYNCLGDIADLVFPPLEPNKVQAKEQFSSFSFWREPLPAVRIEPLSKPAAVVEDSAPAKPQPEPVKPARDSNKDTATKGST